MSKKKKEIARTSDKTHSRVPHQRTIKLRLQRTQGRQYNPGDGPATAPVRDEGNKQLPPRTEILLIKKLRARSEGCVGKGLLVSVRAFTCTVLKAYKKYCYNGT